MVAGGHRNLEFVGDAGSGGIKGVVPAPGAGEAPYLLLGDAVWTDPFSVETGSSNFEVSATGDITTTSTTPVAVSGMSITPGVAGTYLAMFSSGAAMNKNSQTVSAQFAIDTTVIAGSLRSIGGQANNRGNFKLLDLITVTAVQAINIYWFISSSAGGGQGTMGNRTMILIRVA